MSRRRSATHSSPWDKSDLRANARARAMKRLEENRKGDATKRPISSSAPLSPGISSVGVRAPFYDGREKPASQPEDDRYRTSRDAKEGISADDRGESISAGRPRE